MEVDNSRKQLEKFRSYQEFEEYVTRLNQLIKEGDHRALECFINDNDINPDCAITLFSQESQDLLHSYMVQIPNPVCLAATCGNVEVMKTLLRLGFPENTGIYAGTVVTFPLYEACRKGHVEIVKLLVEDYGVDITDTENRYRRSVLCAAASRGHVNVLQFFLERGVSVDFAQGKFLTSALHSGARLDQVEVCKFLLSKGANVNIMNDIMYTPLMYAAENKAYASAKVLLEAGADVNICNYEEQTAFHLASEHDGTEMMELLFSYGADPEVEDLEKWSPLHTVAESNFYAPTYYLVNKLNVTIQPPKYYEQFGEGETVCRVALKQSHFDIVRLLINAGYNAYKELSEHENIQDCDEGDRKQLRELREMVSRPRSLFSLCVLTVRRVLGRRLPVHLERLPLPEILREKIVACSERK